MLDLGIEDTGERILHLPVFYGEVIKKAKTTNSIRIPIIGFSLIIILGILTLTIENVKLNNFFYIPFVIGSILFVLNRIWIQIKLSKAFKYCDQRDRLHKYCQK